MLLFPFQTLQAATDIKKYNIDQTGAKTHEGGLNVGKISCEYHGSLYKFVIKLPITDAENVENNITKKDKYLFLII